MNIDSIIEFDPNNSESETGTTSAQSSASEILVEDDDEEEEMEQLPNEFSHLLAETATAEDLKKAVDISKDLLNVSIISYMYLFGSSLDLRSRF